MQKYKKNHIWKKYFNRLFYHGSNQIQWSSMYNFVRNIYGQARTRTQNAKTKVLNIFIIQHSTFIISNCGTQLAP